MNLILWLSSAEKENDEEQLKSVVFLAITPHGMVKDFEACK